MTETTKTGAGWYPHPNMADTRRYWDGAAWTNLVAPSADVPRRGMRKPEPPGTWVFAGVILTALAVFLWVSATPAIWPLYVLSGLFGTLGWVFTTAGTVALGIRAGARWVDYERQRSN